ncbi:MAG: hypothetical protein JWR19_2391 [Pedosphaera sp.]|nr:hypothetical protein [Pedosphaera sp.]
MRFRTNLILRLGLIWLLLASGNGHSQSSPPTEYQIKAAFVFNFAKFIEWPSTALPTSTSPIVIGFLGENPIHDDLKRMTQNKTIDAHPLLVKKLVSVAEATNCQILFIGTSERARLPLILNGLKGTSVLTVAEMDHFIESGGMVNFVVEGTKVRFEINNDAATGAGLKISSKLLTIALHPAR